MKLINSEDYDRTKFIGGSDVAPVLGLSPWTSPLEVWERKTGRAEEQEMNESMHFGNVLEEVVAREFANRNNIKVVKSSKICIHDEHPFSASVDRFILDGKGSNAFSPKGKLLTKKLLEIKTARTSKGWGEEGTDEIPPYYLTQCYWYLAITGCDVIHVAVLIGGSDYREYIVERDDDIIANIQSECLDWWVKHVEQDQPPAPRSYEDAMKLYPESNGEQITASSELEGMLKEQARLKNQIKIYTDAEKEIKGLILAEIGNNEIIVNPRGDILATLKSQFRNTTNWKKFCEDKGISKEDVEEYSKVTTTRVLRNSVKTGE